MVEFNEGVKQAPLAPREESQEDSDWEQWQEDYWDHWQEDSNWDQGRMILDDTD